MTLEVYTKVYRDSPLSLLAKNKDLHSCVRGSFLDRPSQTNLLSPLMPPKKRKKEKANKKRRLEEAAPLYTEDIGTEGVKKSNLVSAANHEVSISSLPLATDEDERRKKRMVSVKFAVGLPFWILLLTNLIMGTETLWRRPERRTRGHDLFSICCEGLRGHERSQEGEGSFGSRQICRD